MSKTGKGYSGNAARHERHPVLVLGARGMLGSACMRTFGSETIGRDLEDFDLANRADSLKAITRLRPRLIVNCAAATDVDRCETDHDYADRGNHLAAKHAAQAAAEVGARLLHVSTDFVFAGDKQEPYQESDPPDPGNYYGHSKLAGERSVLTELPDAIIVRTSWLYGHGGAHFPGKVLDWATAGGPLRIVDDQIGSPTYAEDLAEGLRLLAEQNHPGIYHLGGEGCVSRFNWARETLALAGLDIEVIPVPTTDFPSPAPRPANSCLDCSKAARLGVRLPAWHEGLAHYVRSRRGAC
jgi:dTDP-4-dehydrorhamnose reductase